MIPIPSIVARRLESGAEAACRHAAETDGTVLLVHDDVAVRIEPGDTPDGAIAKWDAVVAEIHARGKPDLPLLSEEGRKVATGDLVETTEDDHYTKVARGSVGLVTSVDIGNDEKPMLLVVRFPRRQVDYREEDLKTLRYVR